MKCEILKDIYLVAAGRFYYTHPANSNTYLVIGSKELALIDAGAGFDDSILKSIHELGFNPKEITKIILTHSHWDHAGGAKSLKEYTGAEIAIHEAGVKVLEEGLWPYKARFKPVKVDTPLKDGDIISVEPYKLQVLYTPGHSRDSVCLLLEHPEGKVLFSGDTVKSWGNIGVTNYETDFKEYKRSLERLSQLKIDVLLPGHEVFVVSNAFEHINLALELISKTWEGFITFPSNPLLKRLRESWGIVPK
ncbi:MAG: MBL fold metallo-hydrolase [Sulfolobales archaeon]